MLDAANRPCRRLFDRRSRGQPPVTIRPASMLPAPGVHGTQPAAGGAVTTAVNRAPLVRLLTPPPRIGRRREHLRVRSTSIDPPLAMALAEPVTSCAALAAGNPAGAPAEHQVVGGEFQNITAEFGTDNRHQPAQQAPHNRAVDLRGGHQPTRRPSNQPASSSTARASSTLRCP